MNVANLELSKELYKVSGWVDTDFYWLSHYGSETVGELDLVYNLHDYQFKYGGDKFPAYDLGYLLRKLPATLLSYGLIIMKGGDENPFDYKAGYGTPVAGDDLIHWSKFRMEVDSPETVEDCLAALAIELFKSKVLTKA